MGGGPGKFSFFEWNSGVGELSMAVAKRWPDATVLSLAATKKEAAVHVSSLKARSISNDIVFCAEAASSGYCHGDDCAMRTLAKIQADSPEFVRFQVLHSRKGAAFMMDQSDTDSVMGSKFGVWLSLALTSFVQLPSHELLAVALTVFGPPTPPAIDHSLVAKAGERRAYRDSTLRLIARLTKSAASSDLRLRVTSKDLKGGMVRLDVVRMLRKVRARVVRSAASCRSRRALAYRDPTPPVALSALLNTSLNLNRWRRWGTISIGASTGTSGSTTCMSR